MRKRRQAGKIEEDILDILRAGGEYTPHAIAKELGVQPSTWLRKHLQSLHQAGCVQCRAELHWSGNIEKLYYRISINVGGDWQP